MVFFIGAIAKNISEKFLAFQLYVGSLYFEFPDMQIYIYENNSTDNTKADLERWAALNSRIHYKCENISEEEFLKSSCPRTMDNKACRMVKIAYARNKLMEMLEETDIGSRDEDRIIMIDPDLPVMFDSDSLLSILKSGRNDYDALFANGKSQRGNYYDASAYFDRQFPFGMELIPERKIFDEKYKSVIQPIPTNAPWIPVISAFGGIGVYRASAIRGLRYSGVVTEDVHKVYSNFCKQYPSHPWVQLVKQKPETHIEGALMGIYLFDTSLFYRNNSGYNYPVICEHVPFHCAMINRGASRLFVDPSLVYVSDHW
jgi:hypothetical protein